MRIALSEPVALAAPARSAIEARERPFLEEVAARLPAPVSRPGAGLGPLRPELFPPCIRTMRRMLEGGENLSHSGRFALAAFLHRVGADFDAIVDAYRGAPDFDESVTRYQVEHITRRDKGRGYAPPDCATLRTHGLCFREGDPQAKEPAMRRPDALCFEERLRKPLQYYRIRVGGSPPPSGSRVPGAPSVGPTTHGGSERVHRPSPRERRPLPPDNEPEERQVQDRERGAVQVQGNERGARRPRPRQGEVAEKEGGAREDQEAVDPRQEAGVHPARSDGLRLRAHVAHQEQRDEREQREDRGGVPRGRDAEEDRDVGVAVQHVVEEVPPQARPLRPAGHFPVERRRTPRRRR